VIKKSIQCTTEPLEYLLKNKETVDFRLDEDQWSDLNVGDIIEYWEDFTGWQKEPSAHSRKAQVRITEVFRVKSFSDLILLSQKDGLFIGENPDEIISNLRQWWTEDKEKSIGVLGLKVTLI